MKICCTHPGKVGDALYSFPVMSLISKKFGSKVDFVTSNFCASLVGLAKLQPYINDAFVSDSYVMQRADMGVQPWCVDVSGYDKVFHLGFRGIPDTNLPQYMSNLYSLGLVERTPLAYPDIETLDIPYITIAPRADRDVIGYIEDFVSRSKYPCVIVGGSGEYPGFGINKTGLSLEDTTAWIAKSIAFVGRAACFVIADSFQIPKVLLYKKGKMNTNHFTKYDNTYYLEDYDYLTVIRRLKLIRNTLSRTLLEEDYELLGGHSKHIHNVLDHFNYVGIKDFRFEHKHRNWEYATAYKAVDSDDIKTILDVGGGGSLFAPAMAWIGKEITQIDPGDVGGWITRQESVTGSSLRFIQEDFISFTDTTKYDAVTCLSVIEHIPNDEEFFLKLLSLVKKGGLLVMTTDFHPSGVQIVSGHIRAYNKDSMMKFVALAKKKGFVPYGGEPDYDSFEANVNGCTFASLVMKKK